MPLVLDGTNGVSGVDGTASNPAIEGTDSNTGIFYPAADTVAIGTGGTEALRVNSSQNVGIGTTSPNGTLTINKVNLSNGTVFLNGATTGADFMRLKSTSADGVLGIESSSGSNILSGSSANATVLYTVGATPLQFGTNSLVKATLDASGNFYVGTTSQIGGSQVNFYQPSAASMKVGVAVSNGTFAAFQAFVNNTSTIIGNENSAGGSLVSGSAAYSTVINNTGAYPISFGTNNTERARITSGGEFLIGATATVNSALLYVNGSVSDRFVRFRNTNGNPYGQMITYAGGASPNGTSNEFLLCEDNTAARAAIRSNGGLANYSANNVNLSDRREKTNFAPAKNYLDVICAIPVQTFNYIDQNVEDDPGLTLGVVAQDVQSVAPEMVMESNWAGKDEEPKMRLSIYQTDLQYALMKSIQELKAIVDAQAAEIAALKGNA